MENLGETAIEQIREVSETEYAAVPIRTGHPEGEVRLIDVLLRPEVLVFEPLWTVIPGNKAILPVLWQLFPNHRYLLDTDFEVNDLLKQTGYAVKPIAGRCGSNIDLISAGTNCWINPAASLLTAKYLPAAVVPAKRRRQVHTGLYLYRGRKLRRYLPAR